MLLVFHKRDVGWLHQVGKERKVKAQVKNPADSMTFANLFCKVIAKYSFFSPYFTKKQFQEYRS